MKLDRSQALVSPLRYPGGKSRAALCLLPFVPEHTEYREPFVGGGGIFLRKPKVATSWINDLHPGLYAFWRALRDHFDEFAALCEAQDTADLRATFNYWIDRLDLMKGKGNELIVERALQYYFINRTVWTGRVVYDPTRRSRLYFSNPGGWANLDRKLTHLRACADKLRGVRITRKPFERCLEGAGPDTFVYADPPYYRDSLDTPTSRLYEGHFAVEQHQLLHDLLAASPAKAMISYDDRPEIRKLYRDRRWRIIPLEWKYCGRYAVSSDDKAAGRKERKVTGRELLILNYPPPTPAG